jgi:hypothetical protein
MTLVAGCGIFITEPVMPGLVPGIHVFLLFGNKTWMAGTSPAMTNEADQ